MTINKVAVIGAGLMGSGIAAQIANSGTDVVLLDIVPPKLEDFGGNRNAFAEGAVQKMLKADPAPFMTKKAAKRITTGNMEDDLNLLKACDWIVEVVLEDLKIKHATYEKIEKHRKKGAIISSNTSTIPLNILVKPFDKEFQEHFVITHFFNPPRYMRLMELVSAKNTNKTAVKTIRDFCDVKLGKGVVECHDTPGFIANRLGVFWLMTAVNVAVEKNISVEVADLIMGKPCGIPKTGVFGLLDLIGIDLMPHLSKSLLDTLPKKDLYRESFIDHPFIHKMIEAGYTGRKGNGGFYRLNPDAPKGVREKQSFPLKAESFDKNNYTKSIKPKLKSVEAGRKGLKSVVTTEDQGGAYAWDVLSRTLHYAASLVPEIAGTIAEVDEAMRLGYNWKKGPFEMIDALGASWFAEKLKEEGLSIPPLLEAVGEGSFYTVEDGQLQYFGTDGQYHDLKNPKGVLLLRDIKRASDPVAKTASATLWDIGDGVLCFEFTGKMNAIDETVFDLYAKTIKLIGDGTKDYKALVIYNEGSHFCAGANLGLAIFAMNIALWPQIESLVTGGQQAYMALKYAPFPVVSAPSGMALGGGCEILLHSDHVQAHAETYTGLVEVGVGLIPGWGGCKEMILRAQKEEAANYNKAQDGQPLWFSPKTTPMGATRKAFETIALAKVAKSAQEAKEIGYLTDSDGITMNRDRLLYDAKQKALELSKNYKAPEPIEDIRLPGASGKAALDLAVSDLHQSGKATGYDVPVSQAVATVLSGGDKADWTKPLSEKDLLKLEAQEFMKLVRNEGTQARIEHMLLNGKPLRN